ncbi:MAG: acyl--CoA ligase [Desulfobacterales bacterium]|nr:acyl--CoA ligase [Desulfobacterales bacterium]
MNATASASFRIGDPLLEERLGRLLAGPADPLQPYVIGVSTHGALYPLAAHIRAACGGDAAPVCLCAQDKTVMAAALLAALAGGPTVILPHAFDAPVLDELHRLTGFRTLVSDLPRPVPAGVRCFVPAPGLAAWPSAATLAPRSIDAPWLRLFTGGSTGAPKMWTKTVRNLLAETLSIIANYQVGAADRILATVSPNHIYGLLYAVLTPLLASAAVAAPTPSFPAEIEAAGRQSAATILVSVPAHYRALNGHRLALPDLRLAFSSAGMLAEEDAAAFSAQTGVAVAEIYGSTETGGIAARVRANGEKDFKPYPAIEARIAGERFKVRSDYLSPELPLGSDGYYEMGDRVQATAGGRFALLGRADGIVKVGGRRVDLESVRQTLKGQPGVRDAVAISLPVGGGRENRIVAVVEADAQAVDVSPAAFSCLAPHARPRGIKVLSKIPMTTAGKYDRKRIAALFQATGEGGDHGEAKA